MNERRKRKLRERLAGGRERLEAVDRALQEIVPDNLRIAGRLLIEAAAAGDDIDAKAVQRNVARELDHYARLIDRIRAEEPEEPWTEFQPALLDEDPEINKRMMFQAASDEIYINNRYQVNLRWCWRDVHDWENSVCRDCGADAGKEDCPEYCTDPDRAVIHLSIKRTDKAPIHDWRDLQRIKNEIAGPHYEAVEIYPSEERLVDTSNQYHLWVMPKGEKVGLGYRQRFIMETEDFGVRQRPFTDAAVKAEAARTYEALAAGQIDGPVDAIRSLMAKLPEEKKEDDAREDAQPSAPVQ